MSDNLTPNEELRREYALLYARLADKLEQAEADGLPAIDLALRTAEVRQLWLDASEICKVKAQS